MFLDASAWIELLRGSQKGQAVRNMLGERIAYASSYTVYEVCAVLGREGEDAESVLRVLLGRALILHLSSEIAANSAQFYKVARTKKPKLSAGDAITYMSADELGYMLITCDNDFAGVKNVIVVR